MTMQRQHRVRGQGRSSRIASRMMSLLLALLAVGVWMQPVQAQEDIVRAAVSDPVWQAAYWDNRTLSGPATVSRSDANLDFDWGTGSPDPALPADGFSARWTRYLYLEAGTYRFRATADDGVRVFVNDQSIIDGWFDHDAQTFSGNITLTTGHHLVRVEYYENADRASVRLAWERLDAGGEIRNWRGEYFNNRTLTGSPALVRDDRTIQFDWGRNSPAPGTVDADNFSARWTRTLNLPAGTYRFQLHTDDGARLWVNNALLIDAWDEGVLSESSDIYLPGGPIPVRLEYFDFAGDAFAHLAWERRTTTPPADERWQGAYFANRDLSGSPALTREEERIDFDWGTGSPAPGTLSEDNFSVRWTRTLALPAGRYRFTLRVDDGARLWVGDELMIDQWRIQPDSTYSAEIALTGDPVPVKLEYFEAGNVARVALAWEALTLTPPIGYWRGEYFNNADLSGAPALLREDDALDFAWGTGSPAPGVITPNDFSARWTRALDLTAGTYRFQVQADDGVRLWVSERLLIDEWTSGPGTHTAEIRLPGGRVPIRLEYFELGGAASLKLAWERIDGAATNRTWRGEYFNNLGLTGTPALVRQDRAIDFDWGAGSPDPAINSDNFAVRWSIALPFSAGRYRFITESDDGVRLYVNDRLVINQWQEQPRTRNQVEIDLRQGTHRLRLEYFEQTGPAVARLGWRKIADPPPEPVGNILTCVPPQPDNLAWIRLYRLDSRDTWVATGRGIGTTNRDGTLKIDGLVVDTDRFGEAGEPYRVEQWVNNRVVQSTGNFQRGEPEFRVRPFTDNRTPWSCD